MDPILNDLDSNDLVEVGLLNPGNKKSGRTAIKISTIGEPQIVNHPITC